MITSCQHCGETLYNGQNLLSGVFGPGRAHTCPPAWVCWADDPEDKCEVRARDAEAAAIRFAEKWDEEGALAAGQCEMTVSVSTGEHGPVLCFAVRGEYQAHYYAGPVPVTAPPNISQPTSPTDSEELCWLCEGLIEHGAATALCNNRVAHHGCAAQASGQST